MGKFVKVGLPLGFQEILTNGTFLALCAFVNRMGLDCSSGYGVAQKIQSFVMLIPLAIMQSLASFVAQNVGAGKSERIGKVLRTCLAVVAVVGLVMGNIFNFFGPQLVGIYTKEPATIQFGIQRMAVICTLYFLCGFMDVICGSLRGMGYSTVPMIVSIVGACGLRIVWILTVFRIYHDLTVLYISYPVTWFITASAHLISYFIIKKQVVSKMGR